MCRYWQSHVLTWRVGVLPATPAPMWRSEYLSYGSRILSLTTRYHNKSLYYGRADEYIIDISTVVYSINIYPCPVLLYVLLLKLPRTSFYKTNKTFLFNIAIMASDPLTPLPRCTVEAAEPSSRQATILPRGDPASPLALSLRLSLGRGRAGVDPRPAD